MLNAEGTHVSSSLTPANPTYWLGLNGKPYTSDELISYKKDIVSQFNTQCLRLGRIVSNKDFKLEDSTYYVDFINTSFGVYPIYAYHIEVSKEIDYDVETDEDESSPTPIKYNFHITLTAKNDDQSRSVELQRSESISTNSEMDGPECADNYGAAFADTLFDLIKIIFNAETKPIDEETYNILKAEYDKKNQKPFVSSCTSCGTNIPCQHGSDTCGNCTAEILSSHNEIYICAECQTHKSGVRYVNKNTGKIYCPRCAYGYIVNDAANTVTTDNIVCLCDSDLQIVSYLDNIIAINHLTNWFKLN